MKKTFTVLKGKTLYHLSPESGYYEGGKLRRVWRMSWTEPEGPAMVRRETVRVVSEWADRGRVMEAFGLCHRNRLVDCGSEVAAYFRKFYGSRRFVGEIR